MFRKYVAAFGVASVTAALSGCGDASDSAVTESGEGMSPGVLESQAMPLPLPDPDKVPPNPFDDQIGYVRYARLASTIESERIRQGVPGIAVGVIENGNLMWSRGFGRTSALDVNSASVSKATMFRSSVLGVALTKTLALNLVDKGEISINEELATYLPNLKLTYDPMGWFKTISMRDLLTWSSGLPRSPERWYQSTAKDAGLAQWADSKIFSDMYVDFPPGRLVAGQSAAEPRLLALVAESVTGRAFRKLVADRLLEPLGMDHTIYLSSDVDQRGVAVSQSPVEAQDAAVAAPIWGPYTNVADLAKFVQFYIRGNEWIMSDNLRNLAMHRAAKLDAFADACGEAFVFHTESPRCANNDVPEQIVSMDIGAGGFKSAIYLAPAKKFAIVLLSNGQSWDAQPIVAEAFRLAGIDSRTWTPTAPDYNHFARYEGRYATAAPVPNRWINVKHRDEKGLIILTRDLYMEWHDADNNARTCSLQPVSIDSFKCKAVHMYDLGVDHGKLPISYAANEPGWNPVGGIPWVPQAEPFDFEVRFVYDKRGEIEYVASAPLVGKKLLRPTVDTHTIP